MTTMPVTAVDECARPTDAAAAPQRRSLTWHIGVKRSHALIRKILEVRRSWKVGNESGISGLSRTIAARWGSSFSDTLVSGMDRVPRGFGKAIGLPPRSHVEVAP